MFIDGLDEVTRFFEGIDDIVEAVHRVNTEADVVWVDGHSDYGHAFEVFWERYGTDIGPKTTVMILGDARNNYHASQAGSSRRSSTRPATCTGSTPSRELLGHRRLDRGRVRHPLRRRVRVPQPAPARRLRRQPGLTGRAVAQRRSHRSNVKSWSSSTLAVWASDQTRSHPWSIAGNQVSPSGRAWTRVRASAAAWERVAVDRRAADHVDGPVEAPGGVEGGRERAHDRGATEGEHRVAGDDDRGAAGQRPADRLPGPAPHDDRVPGRELA